jgi:hypothetical protein
VADKQVLQEFLARLGFEVHQPSMRSFLEALKSNCITAGKVTAGLVGAAVAAEGLAVVFARSSERVFYASQRVRASASNMQALEFGAKQIGINVEDIRANLEGLATQLRMSPATSGILDMLGVSSEGQDRVEVLLNTVQKLKEQFSGDQYFVGAQFAKLLGLDEKTYLMMSERIDEMREFYAERKRLQQGAGVDPDRAAKAGREFMIEANRLWEKLGLLGDKFKIELLEPFKQLNKEIGETITQFTTWLSSEEGKNTISAFAINMRAGAEVMSNTFKSIWALQHGKVAEANKYDSEAFQGIMYLLGVGAPTDKIKSLLDAAGRGKGNLEVNLPGAQRNQSMPLPAGLGDLSGNQVSNLDFLYGELTSGRWNKANKMKILNEINSVLGEDFPGGQAPLQAQLGAGNAVTFTVNSNINVSGARDAEATAGAVERSERRVMGDAVRNLQGATR